MSDSTICRLLAIFSIVFASSLLGCGKKEANSAKSASSATELEGTWKLDCTATKDSQGEVDGYVAATWEFKGAALTSTFSLYESTDKTCGTAQLNIAAAAAFSIGAASAVESGAKEIDLRFTKREVTLYHADFVGSYNDMKYCGFDDWTSGVAKDIVNLKCSEDDSSSQYFDIFKVEGTSLTWGDDDDDGAGSTAADRPKKLDATQVFKRQQ